MAGGFLPRFHQDSSEKGNLLLHALRLGPHEGWPPTATEPVQTQWEIALMTLAIECQAWISNKETYDLRIQLPVGCLFWPGLICLFCQ